MAQTSVNTQQVRDGTIQRSDLNVSSVGQAVIAKLIGGIGISLSATGADAGTGDVTANVVGVRTTFSDANYTILAANRYVATTTTTFTASRTATLPAANAVAAGTLIYVGDDGGSITAAFTLSIARAGTDTIHKQASSIVLSSPFACVILESDGVSNWTTVSRSPSVNVVFITSGTTYTPSIGVKALYVECVGGGGGGSGAQGTASSASMGSGGGGAGYAAVRVLKPKASYTIAIGGGGSGGVTTNGAGGSGGDTTFDSPSICTGKGGAGANAPSALSSIGSSGQGGGGGGAGAVGDFQQFGQSGQTGIVFTSNSGLTGRGGAAAGGFGGCNQTQLYILGGGLGGNTGGSFGAGGSGGGSGSATGQTGGQGAAGAIRVTEFF